MCRAIAIVVYPVLMLNGVSIQVAQANSQRDVISVTSPNISPVVSGYERSMPGVKANDVCPEGVEDVFSGKNTMGKGWKA